MILMSPFHSLNLSFSMLPMILVFVALMFMSYKLKNKIIYTIVMLNMLGLIPEFWSPTSYLWGNMLMGFFTWMLYSMNKIFNNFKFWSSHMLPIGSPLFLWSFLVILELLSQMIRPLTLSLRLTCNLMTGHVMLSLIMSSKHMILFLFVIMLFEMCVAVIQSVVFNLLLDSYKFE
uniref:ATP synthase subunit a n=1 Tax=Agamermis sp. BH-2006 TaxID=390897 RepID=Q0Z883_9BILA|nr:ATP synthase F0 subunit 6 [Agamermis sp. BH-2006]ABG38305.1 ATP synthase F0 subunit 6 [Agamermis sp. BH-2006]